MASRRLSAPVFLAASLAIHLPLLRLTSRGAPKSSPPQIVDFLPPVEAPPSPEATRRVARPAPRKRLPVPSLSDLLPFGRTENRLGAFRLPVPSQGAVGTNEDAETGLPLPLAEARHAVRYDRLFAAIDHALDYPSDIKEAGIEGVVRVRLEFRDDGSWAREATRIETTSRYLKVLVHRAVRSALRDPMRPAPKRRFGVDAVFEFEILRRLAVSSDFGVETWTSAGDRQGLRGSKLRFYRAHNPASILRLHLARSPQTGNVAAGVGIDVMGLILGPGRQLLEAIAPPPDPLQKYRDDPAW